MHRKNLYSTKEVADILHLSRIEVFRKIKAGKMRAEKIGRNYVVHHDSLVETLGETIGVHKKQEVEKVIYRALSEYGETFRRLGRE